MHAVNYRHLKEAACKKWEANLRLATQELTRQGESQLASYPWQGEQRTGYFPSLVPLGKPVSKGLVAQSVETLNT